MDNQEPRVTEQAVDLLTEVADVLAANNWRGDLQERLRALVGQAAPEAPTQQAGEACRMQGGTCDCAIPEACDSPAATTASASLDAQSNVPPPFAAPVQRDASEVVLSEHEIGAIMRVWQRTSNSRYELCRAVEAEVVRRCRAQRTNKENNNG